jgi:hypothetical protein
MAADALDADEIAGAKVLNPCIVERPHRRRSVADLFSDTASGEAGQPGLWLDSGSKKGEDFCRPERRLAGRGGAMRSRGPGDGPDLLRSGQQLPIWRPGYSGSIRGTP